MNYASVSKEICVETFGSHDENSEVMANTSTIQDHLSKEMIKSDL